MLTPLLADQVLPLLLGLEVQCVLIHLLVIRHQLAASSAYLGLLLAAEPARMWIAQVVRLDILQRIN
jgi:hypothetical protein